MEKITFVLNGLLFISLTLVCLLWLFPVEKCFQKYFSKFTITGMLIIILVVSCLSVYIIAYRSQFAYLMPVTATATWLFWRLIHIETTKLFLLGILALGLAFLSELIQNELRAEEFIKIGSAIFVLGLFKKLIYDKIFA
ncbi:hypothetical protein KJ605_01730 [Patescibacteria group bacterium]|nr:hypothetical protein [Patescibacteria group bacterium]MBU1970475.1 hypothetical protein [Patescibacteria group bacterium]